MGAIRKTASISTLGLIRFRSKSERLVRAQNDLDRAQTRLAAATASADASNERARRAERRARKAEVKTGLMTQSRRGRRWGRKRLANLTDAATSAADALTPG